MHVVVLALLSFLSFCAVGAKINAIEIKNSMQNNYSIDFTLDHIPPHHVSFLANPSRIVVEFEQTELTFKVNDIKLKKELVKSIRTAKPNPGDLRIIFELSQATPSKNANLHKNLIKSSPISLNFIHDKEKKTQPLKTNSPSKEVPLKKEAPVKAILLKKEKLLLASKPTKKGRNIIVVLDPGHGGKDPGAVGTRKNLEKTVTLSIARKLKENINKQPGMRAILTRNGDYYIGLRERLKIARRNNADIFISIHADAFINKQSRGASIFALSSSGATSEAARWLAEKENYSELDGVNLSGLKDRSAQIRTLLIDLSQTTTINSSLLMGKQVLNALGKITALHNDQVEQAGFMVLKSPDIPSILIETGFITNTFEERKLTNQSYQNTLTQAVVLGLVHHFKQNPPQGSYFEEITEGFTIHLVRSGETLSKIASLYGVSVKALQSKNKLFSSQIKVGQSIKVPLV